jgi:hypothetical protein
MNIDQDQEQTTQTTEQTSSDQSTSNDQSGSNTSTTDQTQPLDLSATDDDQTTDTNAEDQRTDEERAAEEARAELFGAPAEGENYAIEGLPEGMEIDKEALDAVAPTFRELGLSNKGASKVAAVYAEQVLPKVMERATASIEQQVIAQRTEWEGEARQAIKDNGKDLKNAAGETLAFDAKDEKLVLAGAAKALDKLAPVGFREFLKDTGLSQHPSMVAFAYQAGKLLAEDTDLEDTTTSTNSKPQKGTAKSGGLSTEKFYS